MLGGVRSAASSPQTRTALADAFSLLFKSEPHQIAEHTRRYVITRANFSGKQSQGRAGHFQAPTGSQPFSHSDKTSLAPAQSIFRAARGRASPQPRDLGELTAVHACGWKLLQPRLFQASSFSRGAGGGGVWGTAVRNAAAGEVGAATAAVAAVPAKLSVGQRAGAFLRRMLVPTRDTLQVWGIIGLNVAVYYLWKAEDEATMEDAFMISGDAVADGRWHTAITSAVSQRDLYHLGTNMAALYAFGTDVAQRYGGARFLSLYFAGGVAGSLMHVAWWGVVRPHLEALEKDPKRRKEVPLEQSLLNAPAVMGSQGAIYAVCSYAFSKQPLRIQRYRLIPVPAILLQGIFVYQDWMGMLHGGSPAEGHAIGMGGLVCGIVMAALL